MSGRRKVMFCLDDDVLRAARVTAARNDRRDTDVVEDASRESLAFDAVERVRSCSDLSEEQAMELAVSDIHAMRNEKRAARGS
jgi:hypothetical protein